MKTSRLIIITTAVAFALAAPVASARVADDPGTARTHVEKAATGASIAQHHEQISQQQYVASHAPNASAEPLTDSTDTGGQFPLVLVLAALTIPLGLGVAKLAAKPVRAYARHRHPPASLS